MVRAVTFHQCGPGVLVPASKPHPGTPVFASPEKPSRPNYNSIWNARTDLLCFIGEQITIFLTLFKVKRACLDRFSSSPAPLGLLQCPVTIFKVTTSDQCCDNLKQCRYNVAMHCCATNLRFESLLVPEFYGTFLHSSIIQD